MCVWRGWGGVGVNGNRKLYLGLDSTLFSIDQFYQRTQHWELVGSNMGSERRVTNNSPS